MRPSKTGGNGMTVSDFEATCRRLRGLTSNGPGSTGGGKQHD